MSMELGVVNVCAVLGSGGVDRWGVNAEGGLGTDWITTADSYTPVAVSGLGWRSTRLPVARRPR